MTGVSRFSNMRNKKSLLVILGSAFFSAIVAVSLSIAWMAPTAYMQNSQNPIEGAVRDKYYNSGDGLTAETAFEITTPRHLYNLAWLQYLGFYNKNTGQDNRQYYFKLGNNIDMSKFGPIPPIGTELNPFLGNFDGNGYVISGVTISNRFKDYDSHPSSIDDWDDSTKKQPHILGLFGVVGLYPNCNQPTAYDSSINSFFDTGITGATIKTVVKDVLMGVAAGYVNGGMSNILVDVSTIDIDSSITEDTSSYGGFTQNISDYTLVGYTENIANVKKAEQSIYGVNVTSNINYNAASEGGEEGWGGSINMKTIYYRLYAFKKNKTTNVEGSFNWKENRYYYDDVERTNERTGTKTLTAFSDDNGATPHMQRFVGSEVSGHEFIGNYNYFHRMDSLKLNSTYSTTDQSFLYLCGGHYENRTYRTLSSHSGYKITDGNGNYLTILSVTSTTSSNAGTLGNTTDPSKATLWSVPTSGTDYISTVYRYNGGSETTYYLYAYNNNTLRLSASSKTEFTYSKDATSGRIKYTTSNNYFIYCSFGSWSLIRTLPSAPNPTTISSYLSDSYQIFYDGHFLSKSSDTATSSTTTISSSNNYGWRFEDESGNDISIENATKVRIYTRNANNTTNKYYIVDNGSNSNYWRVGLTTAKGNDQLFTVTNAGNGVYYFAIDSYHLVFDGSNNRNIFSTRTADDSNSLYRSLMVKLTADIITEYVNTQGNPLSETTSTTGKGPDYYSASGDPAKGTANSRMYYTAQDTTYFPLNVNKDITEAITSESTVNTAISNNELDPKDSNTGYIVSGSDLTDKSTYTATQSSIRVSEYTITNVSNSFGVNPNTNCSISDFPNSTIYTYNVNGAEKNMGELDTSSDNTIYPRFNETKTSFFNNSLTTTTTANGTSVTKSNANVYGLHFMTSKISTDSVVNGAKVSILGNNCDNYQLPVNCIDFNLKQKGVINFFAGTYFTNNDSFFSLYQIIRNNDAVQKTDNQNQPIDGQYSSYNTISDIKEIVAVYSNDQGSKTSKYSNIYKYKKIVNGNAVYTYSEPYRFDGNQNRFKMDKNSTADLDTAYVDNYEMSESDFNAYVSRYSYTQRLDSAKQLGKQSNAYESNRIYYFEFPMNKGEYCLGSVDGGTGAYLLYLDIGANAAKTQRTVFYEHFAINERTYSYPAGVSLKDLGDPTQYQTSTVIITGAVDASDSACMKILKTAKGKYTIDRNDTDNGNSVALTRSDTNKAPPIYASDSINRIYETSSGTNCTPIHISEHTYDIRRMQYFDYNVNLEYLTVTTFVDAKDQDEQNYTRIYVSQITYAGNTPNSAVVDKYIYFASTNPITNELSDMKIYNSNGGSRYSDDDILDVTVIPIDGNMMDNGDPIVSFRLFQDNGNIYEDVTSINVHIDLNNHSGTYYAFDNYIISFIPVSGSTILIKITFLATGATVYYETTLITGAGQEITESNVAQPQNP